MGMRELIRTEVAQPLNTDGLHLGRPPADAPTQVAQILSRNHPQATHCSIFLRRSMPRCGSRAGSGRCTSRGARSFVQGEIPFLDSEIPSVNGVATARGLAKMYGAIANCGRIDGSSLFVGGHRSAGSPAGRVCDRISTSWCRSRGILGYHSVPIPGVLPGFGHAGLGGSIGWADPGSGMSMAFVHNRLLTPMLLDQATFIGLGHLLRRGAEAARKRGPQPVPDFGAPYPEPPGEVAG